MASEVPTDEKCRGRYEVEFIPTTLGALPLDLQSHN
jgi:hypothetical protein